jgi:hypothetical protein
MNDEILKKKITKFEFLRFNRTITYIIK